MKLSKIRGVFRTAGLFLLICVAAFSFTACDKLPEDADGPAEALVAYIKSFWDSDMLENAIFDAIYGDDSGNEALISFNRVNAMNAKNKIMTKSTYEVETVRVEGRAATIELKIHGINFGTYAETYLSEFDALQASVAFVGGAAMGAISIEEATLRLQMLPYSIVDSDTVLFRDFEQEFQLKYQWGKWVIKEPGYENGKVFLELFAEHMTEVLNREYKFRPGIGEE